MATRIGLAGVLAASLALAGCSGFGGGAQTAGLGTPDPGFSGGLDAGAGIGTGSLGGGTLPGTGIADTVRFAVDQSTLSAEAIGTLNAQIGWLIQNPSVPVEIEGHADERGTEQYNIQLGARRASAVRDYMVSQGIPDTRVRTNTFGRARPVATCPDESCWAQNRRAVTVVVAGPGV
jgi:peptidoglycan-associated lipoprotein